MLLGNQHICQNSNVTPVEHGACDACYILRTSSDNASLIVWSLTPNRDPKSENESMRRLSMGSGDE
eukprot:655637-Heterocapsa_arctica.AAC.1